jgi:hypothetical protein
MKWKNVRVNWNSIITKFTLHMCISHFTMAYKHNSRTPYDTIKAEQAELHRFLISQQAVTIHRQEEL